MKEKEKQLFKALCKFKENDMDKELVEFATPSVLGHLFFNRMQGVAYDVLRKNDLLGKVNREFRNSLGAAYEQNIQKNKSFRKMDMPAGSGFPGSPGICDGHRKMLRERIR